MLVLILPLLEDNLMTEFKFLCVLELRSSKNFVLLPISKEFILTTAAIFYEGSGEAAFRLPPGWLTLTMAGLTSGNGWIVASTLTTGFIDRTKLIGTSEMTVLTSTFKNSLVRSFSLTFVGGVSPVEMTWLSYAEWLLTSLLLVLACYLITIGESRSPGMIRAESIFPALISTGPSSLVRRRLV